MCTVRSSAYDRKRRFNAASDRAFVDINDTKSAKESRMTSDGLVTSSAPSDVTGDVMWHGGHESTGLGVTWSESRGRDAELAPSS